MHAHLVISVAIEILLTSDVVKFSSLGLWLKIRDSQISNHSKWHRIFNLMQDYIYLLKENNFCKQVKENLLQCGGISSTVLRGKEHVREAHLSMVEISRCIICVNKLKLHQRIATSKRERDSKVMLESFYSYSFLFI